MKERSLDKTVIGQLHSLLASTGFRIQRGELWRPVSEDCKLLVRGTLSFAPSAVFFPIVGVRFDAMEELGSKFYEVENDPRSATVSQPLGMLPNPTRPWRVPLHEEGMPHEKAVEIANAVIDFAMPFAESIGSHELLVRALERLDGTRSQPYLVDIPSALPLLYILLGRSADARAYLENFLESRVGLVRSLGYQSAYRKFAHRALEHIRLRKDGGS